LINQILTFLQLLPEILLEMQSKLSEKRWQSAGYAPISGEWNACATFATIQILIENLLMPGGNFYAGGRGWTTIGHLRQHVRA